MSESVSCFEHGGNEKDTKPPPENQHQLQDLTSDAEDSFFEVNITVCSL